MAKHFSRQDDAVIVKFTQEYPTNLAYAFELAADKLNRSNESVTKRWYGTLRATNGAFALTSVSGGYINRKNTPRDKYGNMPARSERVEANQAIAGAHHISGMKVVLLKQVIKY